MIIGKRYEVDLLVVESEKIDAVHTKWTFRDPKYRRYTWVTASKRQLEVRRGYIVKVTIKSGDDETGYVIGNLYLV